MVPLFIPDSEKFLVVLGQSYTLSKWSARWIFIRICSLLMQGRIQLSSWVTTAPNSITEEMIKICCIVIGQSNFNQMPPIFPFRYLTKRGIKTRVKGNARFSAIEAHSFKWKKYISAVSTHEMFFHWDPHFGIELSFNLPQAIFTHNYCNCVNAFILLTIIDFWNKNWTSRNKLSTSEDTFAFYLFFHSSCFLTYWSHINFTVDY